MANLTRKSIRRNLGGLGFLGDTLIQVATTAVPSNAQLDDAALTQNDSFFNESDILIASGLAKGDVRRVLSWTQATHRIVPDRNFSANVANGDEYELHRKFTVAQKNSAINAAIRAAKHRWPVIVEDESIVQQHNQLTYNLVTTRLTAAITDALPGNGGALNIDSTQGLPASGYVRVDQEYLAYAAIASATQLTLAAANARGALGSTAASHAAGAFIGNAPSIDVTAGVDRLQYEPISNIVGQLWPALAADQYELRYNGPLLVLQLAIYPPTPTKRLRLTYRDVPPELPDDDTLLQPQETSFADFVTILAAAYLCKQQSLDEREDTVKGPWIVKGAEFEQAAYKLMTQDRQQRSKGKVIFSTWGATTDEVDLRRTNTPVDRIRL